jgi:hypothetical protein
MSIFQRFAWLSSDTVYGLVSRLRSLGFYATCLRRGFSDVRLCAFPPTACERLCFVASTAPELEALRFEFTQQISFRWQGISALRCSFTLAKYNCGHCPELDRRRCGFMSIASLPLRLLQPDNRAFATPM